MPFASFKNVQKRYSRLHKERSQLENRKKLGLLPKKRDFQLRARDKERKNAKIKELRNKALDKNTDEFYFSMHNSRFDPEKGHIPLNVEKNYPNNELKILFNHNLNHIQFELQKELSKIQQLESKTNLIQSEINKLNRKKIPKHIKFAENYDELLELRNSYSQLFHSQTVTKIVDDDDDDNHNDKNNDLNQLDYYRSNAYQELADRLERAKQLKLLLKQNESKKTLMVNSKRKYRVVFKGSKTSAPLYQFEPVRSH